MTTTRPTWVNDLRQSVAALRPCKLCGTPTEGCTNLAGERIPWICELCKRKEDQAVEKQVVGTVRSLDAAIRLIGGPGYTDPEHERASARFAANVARVDLGVCTYPGCNRPGFNGGCCHLHDELRGDDEAEAAEAFDEFTGPWPAH